MVPLRCPPLHTITSSLARVVSKPTYRLTNLNQVLICTPNLNLTGVMESESMASQAFPACYLAEGCPSDCQDSASRLSSIMIHLGQAFWHQGTPAVIDGQPWELEWHLWEGVILIGRHENVCVMDIHGPTTDIHTVDKVWELDHRYSHRYMWLPS